MGADTKVREPGTNNNLFHLAAQNPVDTNCLKHILYSTTKLDIFERNTAGDTALTLCTKTGNAEAIKVIEDYQKFFVDKTGKKADELMAELVDEEDKNAKAKQKKKEKKQR